MKKLIVAVSDRAVGEFMNPFVVPSRGLAVRSFTDEVNRPESEMHKHPEDYELHCLGEFEPEHGEIYSFKEGAELLVRGKDVIRGQA